MIMQISPSECIPPHGISHPDKLIDFANTMLNNRWGHFPILIGYPHYDKIQLLSGTHRHKAAILAGLEKIPVKIWPYEKVVDACGDLDKWKIIMNDVR